MTLLFVWFDLIAFQLKLKYNALFSDITSGGLKEIRELITMIEKLKRQMTSKEGRQFITLNAKIILLFSCMNC